MEGSVLGIWGKWSLDWLGLMMNQRIDGRSLTNESERSEVTSTNFNNNDILDNDLKLALELQFDN